MYQSRANGRPFEAGHASAGVSAPANSWFFAEGATGSFFDLFFLLANPHATPVTVRGTYLLPDGRTYIKRYAVEPSRRFTIWVDQETYEGEAGYPLAATAVSTTFEVVSGGPVVAERAMWWPGPTHLTWSEAHNSAGSTETALEWAVAEGELADAPRTDTYYLIANPSETAAVASVELLFEDGTPAASKAFAVAPRSRLNVDVRYEFPSAAGKRFAAVVKSTGPAPATPLVVEWAVYADAPDRPWAAGAAALATKLQ
jgi:hypothetical protein